MRRRRLLAGLAAASTLATAGCGDDSDEEILEPPAEVVSSELVREHEGTEDESVTVEGVIERTSDEEITYLEVRVRFLDAEGEVLDTTIEQVSDVDDGDRWEFSVDFPDVGERAALVADHEAEVVENP
ncbi:FxLYD domain-containing protein [Halorubrum sp. AD140]|uniref:FxLYD domain-containing protein n=1 Tax=Halorubrum sp. AD140 TaxID=3050073 RepID=UPI002ACCE450|nr:FxLYD domain-containing protein [Halorubrum sp. AD140]MDZ5811038.1 FxLYD domain-containing protein [Halorubrum sp. AD140]